jgi:outer membrane protein OmpA-like peptidoglycan-associated protein
MEVSDFGIKYILLIFSILLGFSLLAQENSRTNTTNLVNNPGFEEISECPSEYGEIEKAIGWKIVSYTPDLFCLCAKSPKVNAPSNFFGNQKAINGNNYAGLVAYHENSPVELIYTNLILPLEKGKKYKVSFKVSLAEVYSNYACNNIGILFTNEPLTSLNVNKAHIRAESIVNNSKNWTTVSKNFIADDNYKYLVIGNTFDTSRTAKLRLQSAAFPAAYYFVDDVQVSKVIEADDEEYFVKVIGGVYDAVTQKPLKSRIDFVLPDIRYRAFELNDPANGKYKFSNMQRAERFYLEAKAKGYFSKRVMVEGNDTASVFKQDFYLEPSNLGSVIVLENIVFDYGKSVLKPESFPELILVSNFLNEHPNFHVEISGHTDSVGDDQENFKLSEARAEAVVKYIHEKGLVTRERLVHVGYGETQPKFSNDTDEGRQKNRRVELKIVKD